MSFREKILWTTLIIGIPMYLWYFSTIGLSLAIGTGDASLSIGRLVAFMMGSMILMIVAVAIVALLNRHQGTMAPDEREHRIESRGITISYHMLCTGVIMTIGAAWLGWSLVTTVHILAFVFIMAEMSRLVVELHGLRRGY
jgi:phosphate/sulfate permease